MADFHGDGIADLAVIFFGGVRILLGNGDGSFQIPPVSYVAGSNPAAVAVGDFNGDGWPDLVVANSGSNDVSILLNDTCWPSPPGGASPQHPQRRRERAEVAPLSLPRLAPLRATPSITQAPALSSAGVVAAREDLARSAHVSSFAPTMARLRSRPWPTRLVDLLGGGLGEDEPGGTV